MALTKIPRGLLDTGIADSSDATAITIDANENVTFGGTINVTGDGDDIIVSSADYELVLIGNRGSSGADLDKAYIRMKSEGTNTVVIDTAGVSYFNGGNVGIGTTSGTLLRLQSVNSGTGSLPTDGTVGITTANANIPFGVHNESNSATYSGIAFETRTSGAARWLIANEWKSQYLGDLVFSRRTGGTSSAEAMRIDSSGNVGIGNDDAGSMHANANKLVVGTGSGDQGMSVFAGTSVGRYAFARAVGNNTDAYDGGMSYDGSRNLKFHTNAGSTRMTINGSGHVGIGTTPTSWSSGYISMQIGDRGFVGAHTGSDLYVGQNAYFDSTWKYEGSVPASLTQHSGGAITHFVAASGSADSAITWTRALHIKSNGHVGLNSDNPYTRFEVVGTSTAAYSATSFNSASQIGLKQPDNNGGYTGIRFTNTGGNYEGFIGFTQTTASPSTKADFVVQGYNRDSTAYQEKFRITDGGEISTPQNPVFIAYGGGSGWTIVNGVVHLETPGGSNWNEAYDRGGNFNPTNGRFTAPVTGYYLFVFHSYTRANDSTGYVYPNFYVGSNLWQNGSNTVISHYNGSLTNPDYGTVNTAHIYLTANQYVRVGYSQQGNNNSISYHSNSIGFSGHLIG